MPQQMKSAALLQALRSKRGLYLAALALVAFMVVNFGMLYRSQQRIRSTEESMLIGDATRHARTISQFFSDSLASLQDFVNSTVFIAEAISNAQKETDHDAVQAERDNMYRAQAAFITNAPGTFIGLTFIPTSGMPTTRSTPRARSSLKTLPELLDRSLRKPAIQLAPQSEGLYFILTIPYIYNGELLGHVGAVITNAALAQNVKTAIGEMRHTAFIAYSKRLIPIGQTATPQFTYTLPEIDSLENEIFSEASLQDNNTFQRRFYVIRRPINQTPLELLTFIPASEIDERLIPPMGFAGITLLGFIVLCLMYEAAQSALRNTALSARIEEIHVKERAIAEHNIRLQEEIEERTKAESLARASQDELRQARDTAEAANRAKGEFLANISHEIRTPMNAIVGMADLTILSDLDPTRRRNLTILRDAAGSLLKLLNQLLDFSRLESGKIDLEIVPFSIRDVMNNVYELMVISTRKKQLSLTSSIDDNLPDRLTGDADRIRQILLNLVGNAVKFTEQGAVGVRATLLPHSPEGNGQGNKTVWVQLAVSDTGIGIPLTKQSDIFDSFSQADGSYSRKYGGAGLGLAICKHIVERMGGSISVESTENLGTTFYVNLPLAPSEEDPAIVVAKPSPRPVRQLTILVVEDNLFNQEVTRQMLEEDGHTVVIAENGVAALRTLEKQQFDLVLMDIQMPEMDGVEATRIIRSGENPKINAEIPVIALSAHTMPEDRERFVIAGMNAHLAKPLLMNDLREMLGKFFEKVKQAPPQEPQSETLINLAEANRMVNNKQQVLKAMLDAYVRTVPDTLQELEKAITTSTAHEVKRLAHSMKSTVRSVGADSIAPLAIALENDADTNDLQEAQFIFEQLRPAILQTVAEVETTLLAMNS